MSEATTRQVRRTLTNDHYMQNLPPVSVEPLVTLLPRDVFEGHPEVLAAYDTMVTLNDAVVMHRTKATLLHAQAQVA